ncbi:hypothetical protein Mgra_00008303 [Meloidogyne graminicola]|uniref:Uncharacterized protein n=1 Tax=Meloidogyne graminicola TaxID=189291 RepID=A0A8S9ZG54_9BILA|nr:hypothetical protein Mgra_00008303 [Meloidogyne graminicola]
MSSIHFNPKNLMFKPTASIIHNIGFSTTQPSSLNILNNLLVFYFEQLCKTWKLLLEESDNTDQLKHALTVFQQNSYFSLNEFKEFLEFTVLSVSNVKPLPYFPVKLTQIESDSKIVFNNTTHMDITLAQINNENFPEYFGLNATDLQMENLLSDSRYANTRKSFRESLDSLASPVLAFCNPVRLDPTMFKKNIQQVQKLHKENENMNK